MVIFKRFTLIMTCLLLVLPSVHASDAQIEICHSKNEDRLEIEIKKASLSQATHHIDKHNDGLLIEGQCLSRECSIKALPSLLSHDDLAEISATKLLVLGELSALGGEGCEAIKPSFDDWDDSKYSSYEEHEAVHQECVEFIEASVSNLSNNIDEQVSEIDQENNVLTSMLTQSGTGENSCNLTRLEQDNACSQAYNSAYATAADELASCYSPLNIDYELVVTDNGSFPVVTVEGIDNLNLQNRNCNQIAGGDMVQANTIAAQCFQSSQLNYEYCLSSSNSCN